MKLVILDRDGVINHDSDDYIKSVDEWQPINGSIEAIARLYRAGYHICVATNQSGLGRGYFNDEVLSNIHNRMEQLVTDAGGHLDKIVWCPHLPGDSCDCRKPLPGMIDTIIQSYEGREIEECWMIGDSLRDLQAGHAYGCTLILVRTGKGSRTLDNSRGEPLLESAHICNDLSDATDMILERSSSHRD